MADDGASTSKATKRKIVSTSDSGDYVFSPPGKKYHLRATTKPGCFFSGSPLSEKEMASSGGSCSIRGPATSYWGIGQLNRLNFQKARPLPVIPMESQVLDFLFGRANALDGRRIQGPEIVTTDMKDKILEACTDNPVKEYIEEVFDHLRKTGFDMDGPVLAKLTQDRKKEIEACFSKKIREDTQSEKSKIPQNVSLDICACLRQALKVTLMDHKSEPALDSLVILMMEVVQRLDRCKHDLFLISTTGETEVKFEICGSLVTSMTNILWEVGQEDYLLTTSFPILMCENKGCYTGGENESKLCAAKKKSEHMKLPQVIGQCFSMADKSVFETEDYKIVYHVSLMSTSKLVITRTHVAKSTLKVIKEGCPIPDQSDLDPSYVFEAPFLIGNDFEVLIRCLYEPLQIFEKLGYLIVCEKYGLKAN